MPKANKHAEVKPSKYKTSLCQFYVRGEECPFAARCAFAHGEAELQTEERNLHLLKVTGLKRLDQSEEVAAPTAATPVEAATPTSPMALSTAASSAASSTTTPGNASFPAATAIRVPVVRQRRPVMVSLPKYGTASEAYASPYTRRTEEDAYRQFSRRAPAPAPAPLLPQQQQQPLQPVRSRCACGFGSTCRRDQPGTYRHNPYASLVDQAEYY